MMFVLALLVGIVMGVVVPWYVGGMGLASAGGLLIGQQITFTIGGETHFLHWSWLAFGVCFVLAWIALSAAEQKY